MKKAICTAWQQVQRHTHWTAMWAARCPLKHNVMSLEIKAVRKANIFLNFVWNRVSHTLWSLCSVRMDTNNSSRFSSWLLCQSVTWFWAPPGSRPHPECCRNVRPLCYTSFLQARRPSAYPCQCSRGACYWLRDEPLFSAAFSVQPRSGPAGCSPALPGPHSVLPP